LYQILYFLALFIGIVPLSILLWKRRAFDKNEPAISFIWVTAVATLYEFFGTEILKINTAYWFQLYSGLEMISLFYYFFHLYRLRYKKILYFFAVVLISTYLISFLYWNEEHKGLTLAVNTFSISLFVFFFSFCYFKDLLDDTKIDLWKKPSFYYTVGLSIYHASTFLLFLFSSYFFKNGDYNYWLVNIIATLILRILLIIGVWKTK